MALVANRHHGALDQFKLERLVIERSDSHVWIVFYLQGQGGAPG
jgi:hypothetical protein